jgi:RNA polymerase sigma-70 factor (ECF subfamily)
MSFDAVDIGEIMASSPRKMDGNDEAALVVQAVKGDSDAFGVLYIRYMDPIYRYIFFRIGEELEAEDLTEEVFVRAWEALPSYQIGEYPFTSWLYRIAHNLIIDHHRKRKPEKVVDLDLYHSSGQSHEDRLVAKQDAARLADAIQLLDDEEQQVLILRFIEGLSHREVALAIGKSEGASRIIQHRALTALYKYLSNQK